MKDELFLGEVEFTNEDARVRITSEEGIWLAINKWGDLAPALNALTPATRTALLDRASQLIDELSNLGLRPFVVGGTLLGAVREGRLLPHDDDADIAYLSEYSQPVDVAIESFRLGRQLQELGYEFTRHSAAHIQLLFDTPDGASKFHIDIFSAFFDDYGNINQPFHVRGPFREDQMLPFSEVQIEGRSLPAPADTEAWLVLNYDENWRTPIPGYRLNTPTETIRRFDNWFGGFNFMREHWNEAIKTTSDFWGSSDIWLAERDLPTENLIEIGSGNGKLSMIYAGDSVSRRVIATDYSASAFATFDEKEHVEQNGRLEYHHVNLNRLNCLAIAREAGVDGSFDFVANHVIEQVSHHARANALRIVRMALRSGGAAYATCYAKPARNFSAENPSTWHLTRKQLTAEASTLGLETEFTPLVPAVGEKGRAPYGVTFSLRVHQATPSATKGRKVAMLCRLKSLLARGASSREISELRARVEALENRLDELTRHNLRVAEMLDLIEQKLTPQNGSGADAQEHRPEF